MGDLHRHAEIARHVIDACAKLRPDEDYVCIELGNYLTDVSQFRDPFAHMYAKRQVWSQSKSTGALFWLGLIPVFGTLAVEAILDFAIDLDEWIDRLLGKHKPAGKRHGEFAGFMTQVIRGVTHTLFAEGAPKAGDLRARILPQIDGLALLPEAELDRLFAKHFTQYFPHEHSDMPPYVLYGEHRPNHRLYRRGPRGLSQYLEEYVDSLAESLAKLEVDWKAASTKPRSDPSRHDVLVRLGNILHAIEDYFFHSNFLELQLWHSLRRGRPSTETDAEYQKWFVDHVREQWLPQDPVAAAKELVDDKWRPSQTQLLRTFMRRLRYPAYRPVNALDTGTSLPSLDHLYTGSFDKKDLFHTLTMALESMETPLRQIQGIEVVVPKSVVEGVVPAAKAAPLRDSPLVLIRSAFNRAFRLKMGKDEDFLGEQLEKHAKQLASGVYPTSIDELKTKGYLNTTAASAWRQAVAIDQDLEKFGERTPGTAGFLMTFLAKGQAEVEDSRRRSRGFDTARDFGQGNVLDMRTSNGATGEHIGMHALMSKDTSRSHPMHEETRRVARFASMAVASLLVAEVSTTSSTAVGLDWDVIVRHYLRFPAGKANMWESQVLEYFRTHGVDPTYDQIPDQVRQPRATGAALTRLARRRTGTVRSDLEKRYIALEERIDHIGNLFG